MYDSSGKRKPVNEKPNDRTEKIIQDYINNFS